MRKCVIHTRVVQEDNSLSPPVLLEPFVHSALYDIPAIRAARQFLLDNEQAELVGVRNGTRCYTITVITDNQAELSNHALELDPTTPVEATEGNCED